MRGRIKRIVAAATLLVALATSGGCLAQAPAAEHSLCWEATYGNIGALGDLLSRGADPNALDSSGNTPLTCLVTQVGVLADANAAGQLRAMQYLLEHGAKVDGSDANAGETPLMVAAVHGDNPDQTAGQVAVVKLLLDKGANVNAVTERQHLTALHWAAYRGYLDTIRLLLARGANRSARNDYGKTPLEMMRQNHNLDPNRAKEVETILAEE